MSWYKRRKFVFGFITTLAVLLLIVIPIFLYYYKAPTCTDGRQNGSEEGIDCGGACTRLCQTYFLPPSVAWTRLEKLAPGYYNVAAYIINPNNDGESKNIPYEMTLYDSKGIQITRFQSTINIVPGRNTLAFSNSIEVKERIPAKAIFDFISAPVWTKSQDTLQNIKIVDKTYVDEDNSSSLIVRLNNNGEKDIARFYLYVVLYDSEKNAIGFSKTVVDGMKARDTYDAPFTWPFSRSGKVVSIEVLPVAE